MKNKNIIFVITLMFIFSACISFAFAEDNSDFNSTLSMSSNQEIIAANEGIEQGCVSGDVEVATSNSYQTKCELDYVIPSEAKEIKSAHVYVNVYSGSAQPTYGAYSNITLQTVNNFTQLGYEELWYGEGSTDGVVYKVNDHITKCYSDYMVSYDVTNLLKGLNGTPVKINVENSEYPNKNFYAKIKVVALFLAYDDGDDDEIYYWLNSNQRWSQEDITDTFNTKNMNNESYLGSELINIALSSSDGAFKFNDVGLTDAIHQSGNYYQYNKWDVTDQINFGQNSVFYSKNMGMSIKDVITILKIKKGTFKVETNMMTEFPNTCYAGTGNQITVNVNVKKIGKYAIKLFADGIEVNSTEIQLKSGNNKVFLTDPTIRPIDESTVNGNSNENVNYTVEVFLDDDLISHRELMVPVLYNGYLSKSFAYGANGYEEGLNSKFTGDIVIDIKPEESVYLYGINRTDIWDVNLSSDSEIVDAWIYVPYKSFDNYNYVENEGMFDATFNDEKVTPVKWYRDQSNLGEIGKEGFGILIYDVSELIKNGENTFNLNKINPTPSLYPTALIYLYNSSKSKVVKNIYAINGADLLNNEYNDAKRVVDLNNEIDINSSDIIDATLYVFSASAQENDGNVIVNGINYNNVWNEGVNSLSLFKTDITGIAEDKNTISFVATGGNILALPQFIVTSKKVVADIFLETECPNTCYAGTNNTLTITIDTKKAENFTVKLFADNVLVNSTNINAISTTKFYLTDLTIREINETTVNGASNNKVNYTVELLLNGVTINKYELIVPVLYNGYLSGDFAFDFKGFAEFLNTKFTGDVVFDVKDDASYLGAFDSKRTDVWNIDLINSYQIVKSFIYVPYTNLNAEYSIDDIEATFNGVKVNPTNYYDQSNLESNSKYGLLVYDVNNLIKNGDNSFVLTKKYPVVNLCPSALIYLYNDTKSTFVKSISIVNNVDLLSNVYNDANRFIQSNSKVIVDSGNIIDSTVYIMSNGGDGTILINGNPFRNVDGSSKSTRLFTKDITNIVKDNNSISFTLAKDSILTLSQIVVNTYISKATVTPTALSTTYDSGKTFNIKVVANKNPVCGLKLTLKVFTGKSYKTYYATTNAKGIASFKASTLSIGTHKVEITSSGDARYGVAKTASNIKIAKAKTTVKAPKVTFKVKKSKYFKVTVKNKATKKAVKSINVKVKVYTGKKYKTYIIKTNKNGVAQLNTKKLKVGKHKVVISSGNAKYTISAKSTITIKR
ncbi:DUF3344 domain-containing protein [Methanobrevibacter sp.]|uniref:DUF3344 domain-containing protein n=1 Tax=Methanobrevibacter sp. TaxID=66852 RepID=UPI003862D409